MRGQKRIQHPLRDPRHLGVSSDRDLVMSGYWNGVTCWNPAKRVARRSTNYLQRPPILTATRTIQ